jgi:hypothetical protein
MFRGTNRIPSGNGSESVGVAARVRARCDVVDAREAVAELVQQVSSTCCSFRKSSVPKPVTYVWNPRSIKVERCFGGTNGIPSVNGRESNGVAARVRARCDVVEALAGLPIQPDIEEAERGSVG